MDAFNIKTLLSEKIYSLFFTEKELLLYAHLFILQEIVTITRASLIWL